MRLQIVNNVIMLRTAKGDLWNIIWIVFFSIIAAYKTKLYNLFTSSFLIR